MDYNPDTVRKLSSEISSALAFLEELALLPEDQFLSDPHIISSAKYNRILTTAQHGAV